MSKINKILSFSLLAPVPFLAFLFSVNIGVKKDYVEINSKTLKELTFPYYYGTDTTLPSDFPYMINLETISKKNNNIKKFIVHGDIINTPIFIPLGSDFELSGDSTARILSSGDYDINYGIIIGTLTPNDQEEKTTNVKIHNLSISTSNDGGYGNNGIFIQQCTNVEIYNNQISTSQSAYCKCIDTENVSYLNIHDNILTSNGVGGAAISCYETKKMNIENNLIQNFTSSGNIISLGDIEEGTIKNNFLSSVASSYRSSLIDFSDNSSFNITNNIFNSSSSYPTDLRTPFCRVFLIEDDALIDFLDSKDNVAVSDISQDINNDSFTPSFGSYKKVEENIDIKLFSSFDSSFIYQFCYFDSFKNIFGKKINELGLKISNSYTNQIIAKIVS
ncbi:MAG: right-handed parallel beta-helix repeat-containing protein [Mycoplasmataceae bacterium]|jgi:hypothetical protein|nr:right-handed parallel beta-helix repeat-containing protein [Mycoplasmataceae bacterium]